METGPEAGKPRAVTPKRSGAKVSGGTTRSDSKTVRLQLHLPDVVVKRLGVHCSLVGRNQSKEAARILLQYLARFGQGRELFPDPGPGDSTDEVESAA